MVPEILAQDPDAQQVPVKIQVVEGTSGFGEDPSIVSEVGNYLALVTVIVAAYKSQPIRNFVVPLVVSQAALRNNLGVSPFRPKSGEAFTPEEIEKRTNSANRVSLYVATTVWALMNIGALAKYFGGRKKAA